MRPKKGGGVEGKALALERGPPVEGRKRRPTRRTLVERRRDAERRLNKVGRASWRAEEGTRIRGLVRKARGLGRMPAGGMRRGLARRIDRPASIRGTGAAERLIHHL